MFKTRFQENCLGGHKGALAGALFLLVGLMFLGSGAGSGTEHVGGSSSAPRPKWPPEGQRQKYAVTRDTWVSSVGEEKSGSNGGESRLKVKGQQEYSLLDIDPTALKRKVITGALLHIRTATARDGPLLRVGISSVASEWVEGTSRGYRPQKGSSCFSQAQYGLKDWAYPGSTLMDVVFGKGHTIWRFADCTPPDKEGWQTCAVEPDVVAARVAELSSGFMMYDEVGSEWSLKGGKFTYSWFPNRFCYSRESGQSAPWMEIWTNGEDSIPPDKVESVRVETEGLPPGQALISWKTPRDRGGGRTLGYQVTYRMEGQERPVPRCLIPMAGRYGEEVQMHIQDLAFRAGQSVVLTIRAVDSAGNLGPAFRETVQVSSGSGHFAIRENGIEPFNPSKDLPKVGNLKVAVVDLLDKIDPQNGRMIPSHPDGYKGGNHIFSAKERRIRLQAARNETVAFQVNLEGRAQGILVDYSYGNDFRLKPKLFQFAYVNVKDKGERISALFPDPLVPLTGGFSIPSIAGEVSVPNQTNHSIICEVYVPHEEPPGEKKGKLVISLNGENLELEVDLAVWDFTLPDKLSFVPEMNAYGTVYPFKGYEYYRLAHEHRTCINWLPYGWSGAPSLAPTWKGDRFEWKEWDRQVAPLLDGSAFADLPRKGEPVDVFYLPFNENWPVSLYDHYRPSYWADEAFSPEYKDKLGAAFQAFARHCDEKKWHGTVLQFYLNNKIYYREKYGKTSAPWLFDEPVNTQDFWTLRWYGLLWHQAVERSKGNADMQYRGDVSYSQFGRNTLWGLLDVEYLGGNDEQKTRMKRDEQMLWGKSHFTEYGTANRIDASNIQPALWCISAWSKGARGVLPWQTIGGKECWKTGEETSLFYPHPEGPKPSLRLKAFARGQQDVEYLTLLCEVLRVPRHAVVDWLVKRIDIDDRVSKESEGDSGTVVFTRGNAVALSKVRQCIGQTLSEKGPPYRRALTKREAPIVGGKRLPDIGYVSVSPHVERRKPDCDTFAPK